MGFHTEIGIFIKLHCYKQAFLFFVYILWNTFVCWIDIRWIPQYDYMFGKSPKKRIDILAPCRETCALVIFWAVVYESRNEKSCAFFTLWQFVVCGFIEKSDEVSSQRPLLRIRRREHWSIGSRESKLRRLWFFFLGM